MRNVYWTANKRIARWGLGLVVVTSLLLAVVEGASAHEPICSETVCVHEEHPIPVFAVHPHEWTYYRGWWEIRIPLDQQDLIDGVTIRAFDTYGTGGYLGEFTVPLVNGTNLHGDISAGFYCATNSASCAHDTSWCPPVSWFDYEVCVHSWDGTESCNTDSGQERKRSRAWC